MFADYSDLQIKSSLFYMLYNYILLVSDSVLSISAPYSVLFYLPDPYLSSVPLLNWITQSSVNTDDCLEALLCLFAGRWRAVPLPFFILINLLTRLGAVLNQMQNILGRERRGKERNIGGGGSSIRLWETLEVFEEQNSIYMVVMIENMQHFDFVKDKVGILMNTEKIFKKLLPAIQGIRI